jgi:hypothetical protein
MSGINQLDLLIVQLESLELPLIEKILHFCRSGNENDAFHLFLFDRSKSLSDIFIFIINTKTLHLHGFGSIEKQPSPLSVAAFLMIFAGPKIDVIGYFLQDFQ